MIVLHLLWLHPLVAHFVRMKVAHFVRMKDDTANTAPVSRPAKIYNVQKQREEGSNHTYDTREVPVVSMNILSDFGERF